MERFKLTPAAKSDIKKIWNYSDDKWGTNQANKYIKLLEKRIKWLAKTPGVGKQRDEIRQGYCCYPEGRHIIFYRTVQGYIEVARILHDSMEPNLHFEKHDQDE